MFETNGYLWSSNIEIPLCVIISSQILDVNCSSTLIWATMQLVHIAHSILIVIVAASSSQGNNDDDNENPCLLYLAQSTIPHAGLGMFTGTSL